MEKYISQQKREYKIALKEIQNGRKESHWIWYIFPQITGLGFSFMCKKYDIQSLDEAKEYLNNDYLRDNLINICKALLTHEGKKDIKEIMNIDDCKLLSCMTLFNKADEEENRCGGIFKKVMDVFYEGKEDELTINILENQQLEKILLKEKEKEKENEKDKKINNINEKKEKEINDNNDNMKKNDNVMLLNEKKEEKKEGKKEEKKAEKKEEKKEEKTEEKKEKGEKDKKKKKKEEKKEGEGEKKEEKKHPQKKAMEPKEIFKLCDLRVGYVEECKILEGFNDIYSLVIDLGEPEKRIIGTGLRNHVPIEKIKNTKLVVFSNLKPKKFGTDFVSNGMILTASLKKDEGKDYELIRPDENAKPGEKVYLDGTELDPKKEETISPKRFGQVMENLKTDDDCFCTYDGVKIRTESGFVKAPMKNAPIS